MSAVVKRAKQDAEALAVDDGDGDDDDIDLCALSLFLLSFWLLSSFLFSPLLLLSSANFLSCTLAFTAFVAVPHPNHKKTLPPSPIAFGRVHYLTGRCIYMCCEEIYTLYK